MILPGALAASFSNTSPKKALAMRSLNFIPAPCPPADSSHTPYSGRHWADWDSGTRGIPSRDILRKRNPGFGPLHLNALESQPQGVEHILRAMREMEKLL